MHYIPEDLVIADRAPQTDAEWEAALRLYGKDRDDPLYRSSPQKPGQPSHRLSQRPLVPRRGMEGSDESDAEDIDPAASTRARKKRNFGVGGMISTPPVCSKGDEDKWDGAAERLRIRQFYEQEGWLPGPLPSYTTKSKRRRVIRRLGLAGNAEADHERRTIITHYMEMAQLALQVDDVGFAILRDDVGYKYSMDPDAEPLLCSLGGTALSQFALRTHAECTAVPDMTKDWRTCGNPFIQKKGMKFLAAVPLLYPRSDPPVAFGCMVVLGREARMTFTEREQAMFLRISSMLVYQLATFQSELLAEKAATMYENSLAFLRRSVVPERVHHPHDPAPRVDGVPPIKARRGKKKRVDRPKPKRDESSIDSMASPVDDLPPFVLKSGPKDQIDAQRRSKATNLDLHQDSADTLRGILEADALAVINMEDYQLFYRRIGADHLELDRAATDPAHTSPVLQFISGQPWPEELQPVVHHIATTIGPTSPILATSAASSDARFSLTGADSADTLSELVVHYLQHRRFWWNRHNAPGSLGDRLLAFCPEDTQTALMYIILTWDGQIQRLILATWDRPPSSFADSSALSLPFVQILGGLTSAALSFRKVRAMERSQISYSNLQAHELRTPLHQILAITQLLRSTMLDLAETQPSCQSYVNSLQQIRDLIPILDAIDTSGKTLHGIVDNILSFLDLKTRDSSSPNSPRPFDAPSGGPRALVDMLEELVVEAHEENERSRRSALQPLNCIETIFEIDPPELGTDYTEDRDGSLRRALAKILSNAYKFIEGEGCVEIKVTAPSGPNAPKDCQGTCLSRKVIIEITDNGPGMEAKFVRDHLGEPWAKQDAFTTGSGLSVHLAYRMIDMMGGHMEVYSAPGRGCVVKLEVPVEKKKPVLGLDGSIAPQPIQPNIIDSTRRKVAIVGFNIPTKNKSGLPRLGERLKADYSRLGAEIVPVPEADLIIANGEVEEVEHGRIMMQHAKAEDIVFLTMPDHEPHPDVVAAAKEHAKSVRRFAKPITPSLLRHTLAPRPPARVPGPHVTYAGDLRRTSLTSSGFSDRLQPPGRPSLDRQNSGASTGSAAGVQVSSPNTPPMVVRPGGRNKSNASLGGNWRPKGMCMEEAIANLSLGDYFAASQRLGLKRTVSQGSSQHGSSSNGDHSTPGTTHSETFDDSPQYSTPGTSIGHGNDSPYIMSPDQEMVPTVPDVDLEPEPEPAKIRVLVVEDNMINRKILVKIIQKLPVEITEAADGVEAVERFAEFDGPSIVLLDINMPRKDGFQACQEMRDIEKASSDRPKAEIIAVTALSAEEEKRRGWQAGFDEWAVKPCGKAKMTKLVEKARKTLLGIMDEPDHEVERRYTI